MDFFILVIWMLYHKMPNTTFLNFVTHITKVWNLLIASAYFIDIWILEFKICTKEYADWNFRLTFVSAYLHFLIIVRQMITTYRFCLLTNLCSVLTIKSLAVLFLFSVLRGRDLSSMKFLLNVLAEVTGDASVLSSEKKKIGSSLHNDNLNKMMGKQNL